MTNADRNPKVEYLIFDIETIADGDLVAKIRFPNEGLLPEEAIARYRATLLAETGRDVFPVTFMLPISVAVAKVDADYRLLDLTVLDSPQFRPHVIARHFWQGWNHYGRPTLVSFNGRGYDLPVLELAAYRYGLSVPAWFNVEARSYERNECSAINDYCRCDVLDTYFVFLRTRVLLGKLTIDAERELVASTKQWLEERSASLPVYSHYLSHWGDWRPPMD